ncbi:MAG: BON domain-containing protein [Planctomycetota bacterium]|nr:BON domain-containing protein [Planctomycetota bacterium]
MSRNDELIKKDIVDSLFWDDRVDASDIAVEVEDGVVNLAGAVPTYLAREAAFDDALVLDGVTQVRNRIDVRPVVTDGPPTDERIRDDLAMIIQRDPNLEAAEINVAVNAGRVTLEGTVDAHWKKFHVEERIAHTRGVLAIDNLLAVVPRRDIGDQAIGEVITAALDRHALVNANDITVSVEDGIVTLTGNVPDRLSRQAAYEAALYTEGVVEIRDELVLSPIGSSV